MKLTIDEALTRGGTGRFQWRLLGIFGLAIVVVVYSITKLEIKLAIV